MDDRINIVIPTYNRAGLIGRAVEAALAQTHTGVRVTVVDDGSTDATAARLAAFAAHPRFRRITLAKNVGTAQAKNVAIALNDCPYITFHDSDDIPHPEKLARQWAVARKNDVRADSILNWAICDVEPGTTVAIDLVVTEHELVCASGQRHHMRRALSLVDDLLPNLQMAAGVPGDWILINPGLFRADVFARLGGFSVSVEEDRDLRNRLIFSGGIVWLIPEILLEKHEYADGLTVDASTNYDSEQRRLDRHRIWAIAEQFRRGVRPEPVPIDLSEVSLSSLSQSLTISDALQSSRGLARLQHELARFDDRLDRLCIA